MEEIELHFWVSVEQWIIISIGAILPAEPERTRVTKQPCVPNTQRVLPGHTTGRNHQIHLSTSPLKPSKRNLSVWNIHHLVCSAPAKAICWLHHKEGLAPHPCIHRIPRAALGAGVSCVGQKQLPNVSGGVCLSFPDVKLDGIVWFCHCGGWILELWLWDFIPDDLEHSCDGKTYFLPPWLPSFLKISPIS